MGDIADRYRRLAAAFGERVAAVPDHRWDAQSPCPEWTARDVVRHVVDSQGMFLGFVGDEMGDIPSVDDDPSGAVAAATAAVQERLDDPARATQTFEGFLGESTLEDSVNRFLATDLVVHAWDLARATGQDERMDPQEVTEVWGTAQGFGDTLRTPGAFGPEIEPPPDASDQDRLLAFLGRQP